MTKLTTTQIGALAENLVANKLMIASSGRLSPFIPVADDDGIDLLMLDKRTGRATPLQVKARTHVIRRSGVPGNTVHFEVRKASFKKNPSAHLLAVLLEPDLTCIERAWLMD